MMKYDDFFNWNEISNYISKLLEQEMKIREEALARLITEYDFIVGSIECEHKLTEILSSKANIIYCPYIADETTVYAIKKFNITDLISNVNIENEVKE